MTRLDFVFSNNFFSLYSYLVVILCYLDYLGFFRFFIKIYDDIKESFITVNFTMDQNLVTIFGLLPSYYKSFCYFLVGASLDLNTWLSLRESPYCNFISRKVCVSLANDRILREISCSSNQKFVLFLCSTF